MGTPKRRPSSIWLGLAAAALVLSGAGCALFDSSGSFSDSSGSLSDSSGSLSNSSESSSDSSGESEGGETAYRRDVQFFTMSHVASQGSPETLRLGLAEVALARGISDWEAIPETYRAVGRGLARAGATPDDLARYRATIARPGTPGEVALEAGYAAARR